MSNVVFMWREKWEELEETGWEKIANTKDVWKGYMGTIVLIWEVLVASATPPHPTSSNIGCCYCSRLSTELDGKAVLLKALNTLVTEHGRKHMVLTWELPPCSLAYIVLDSAMYTAGEWGKVISSFTPMWSTWATKMTGVDLGPMLAWILWGNWQLSHRI